MIRNDKHCEKIEKLEMYPLHRINTVLNGKGETKFDSEFYVSNTKLSKCEELQHEFKLYQPFFQGLIDTECIVES